MDGRALYIISVAARMVGLHVQTLRKYERAGFLEPTRTPGGLRLYSPDDLRRLWQIKRLVEGRGINLAGVQLALELTDQVRSLLQEIDGGASGSELHDRAHSRLAAMLEVLSTLEGPR